MNHIPRSPFLFVLGGLLLLLAPRAAGADADAGLIGQRYVGGDLAYYYYHGSRLDHAWGGTGVVNLPLAPGFDATLAYSPVHLTGPGYSQVDHAFTATGLVYNETEYGKVYFSASLGQSWDTTRWLSASAHNNSTFWALQTGVETAVSAVTAVNYGLGYSRAFHGDSRQPTWQFGAQIEHWITPQWAAVASATYALVSHAPDALIYTGGLRFRF